MNKHHVFAIMTIVVMILSTTAFAEGLIPELKLNQDNNVRLAISGFVAGVYTHELGNLATSDDDLTLTGLRPRLTLSVGEHWEGGLVVDFANLQQPNGNWGRELYVKYKFNKLWSASVGRIFLPAGWSTPALFELETVRYPHADPFSCYGWGAQLEGEFGDGWSIKTSINANSSVSFSDNDSWNRLEFSARLEKKFEHGAIAATTQISDDFVRVASDFSWKPIKVFYLRGEVAYTHNMDTRTSDRVGAYTIAVYRPLQWCEIHSMIDGVADLEKSYMQWETSTADDGTMSARPVKMFTSDEYLVTWTSGFRFFIGKDDRLSLTLDYEMPLDDTRPDTFLARLQFRF